MATFKGQLETKTGTSTSDVLYPKTSVDQVDGLPTPTSSDSGKVVGVNSSGQYVLVDGGGGGSSYDVDIIFKNCSVGGSASYPTRVFEETEFINTNYYFFSSHQLGSLATSNGTINVTTTTGEIYIAVVSLGVLLPGTLTIEGDIVANTSSLVSSTKIYLDMANSGVYAANVYLQKFVVSSNGTITFNGFLFDD